MIAALAALALLAYLTAWNVVSRQRTGGGVRENWLKKRAEHILDLLPRTPVRVSIRGIRAVMVRMAALGFPLAWGGRCDSAFGGRAALLASAR